jgi:antimicrobial peptide system SdpA family protein
MTSGSVDATETVSPRSLLGLLCITLVAAYALIGAYALHGAAPHNPVPLPYERELRVNFFLPEGWAFFSKSPRDEQAVLLNKHPGQWVPSVPTSSAQPGQAFGLSRSGRRQWMEFGVLRQAGGSAARWYRCSVALADCLDRLPATDTVRNPVPFATICGTHVVVRHSPLPWAWARSEKPVRLTARLRRLEIVCDGQ